MNGVDLVGSTSEPAFTVDCEGVIRAWNAAAEEAFDVAASEACGRECWQLLEGRDAYGNDYCSKSCPLLQMGLAGKAVHRCELFFRDGSGRVNPYSVSTMVLRGSPPVDPAIVHLLQRLFCDVRGEAREKRRFSANHDRGELTPREIDVLRLLADGTATAELARTLCISQSTARNHVQHILFKLRVHNRLEAVVTARKAGLI